VESVAWISCARDLAAALFTLTAALVVLRDTRLGALVFGTLLFSCGLLCKPSGCVFPAVFFALLYQAQKLERRRAITLALWLLPALASAIATKMIQQPDTNIRVQALSWISRLQVGLDSLSFYTLKFLWPYPLASDYGRTPQVALHASLWWIGLAVLLACLALGLYYRARLSRIALGAFPLFALWLSPILGVIPFQAEAQSTISDRYNYMPLIALGIGLGLAAAKSKWVRRLVLGVCMVWAGLTFARAQVWLTNKDFFEDMLAKNPKSHVALSSLGVEYILRGDLPTAKRYLDQAVALRPNDIIPRTNLANVYLLSGDPARVVSEIEPLLNDKEFLHINQTETRALASAYRLTARAEWHLGNWQNANDFYCRWFHLDYTNEQGKAEILAFLKAARQHAIKLPNCTLSFQ
jgi:tetratricopeptide (TPR) repeat protein